MRIFLIGFMGCGKSSVGRRLARKLGYDFFDTDHGLKQEHGIKVPELFRAKGEPAFRLLEQEVLHSTAKMKQTVIATGGGTPCYADNMDFILKNGMSVYIRMSVSSLVYRLEHARVKRPLVENLKGEDLAAAIEALLKEREAFYMRANCVIKGETLKPSHIISLVFGGAQDQGERPCQKNPSV